MENLPFETAAARLVPTTETVVSLAAERRTPLGVDASPAIVPLIVAPVAAPGLPPGRKLDGPAGLDPEQPATAKATNITHEQRKAVRRTSPPISNDLVARWLETPTQGVFRVMANGQKRRKCCKQVAYGLAGSLA
jgi:hypothetical protein